MERRDFLITATAAAAFAGLGRELFAQGRGGTPTDWTADPGKPSKADPAKLARISMMTLNFTPILKLPANLPQPPAPGAPPAPAKAAPATPAPPVAKTLEVERLAEMLVDVYGVH